MRPISMKKNGRLLKRQEPSQEEPEYAFSLEEEGATWIMRFALLVQGPESHIFPALLLDDWGNERKSLSLYRWIRDNGNEFPRAEIFGFTLEGKETQHFLREFEIYFKYPCYVYGERRAPVSDGHQISRIFLPDPDADTLTEARPPSDVGSPLRRAQLTWWRANSATLAEQGWTPVSK